MLRSVQWQLSTDVSGKSTCPIFKGQEDPKVLEFLIEYGDNKLSRNVGTEISRHAVLHPGRSQSHLHRGIRLKSLTFIVYFYVRYLCFFFNWRLDLAQRHWTTERTQLKERHLHLLSVNRTREWDCIARFCRHKYLCASFMNALHKNNNRELLWAV